MPKQPIKELANCPHDMMHKWVEGYMDGMMVRSVER